MNAKGLPGLTGCRRAGKPPYLVEDDLYRPVSAEQYLSRHRVGGHVDLIAPVYGRFQERASSRPSAREGFRGIFRWLFRRDRELFY